MKPAQIAACLKAVLPTQHKTRIVPFIWGPPGAGKSDVVQQSAEALDSTLIDIRLSEHDASELKGIDMPDVKTKQLVRFAPEFLGRMDKNKKFVIFFDEANSGHPSTQPPLYKIALNREIGNVKLGDNVSIVMAGNRETDRSITNKMSMALANRLMHLNFEVNEEDLSNWAMDNNVDPRLIGFWRFRPNLIHAFDDKNPQKAWPSPRTWARVSSILDLNLKDEAAEAEMIEGTVGTGAATEFTAFMKVHSKLPKLADILKAPKTTKVPGDNDTAARYALATSLAAHAKDNNFDALMTYMERMDKEFQVLMVRDSLRRKVGIETTTTFSKWAMDNAEVLA